MPQDNNDIIHKAFDRHKETLEATRAGIITDVSEGANLFCDTVLSGGTVFTCGNGGSAADAQHLVGELLCRYKDDRKSLPAMALIADPATLTAIGNDYEYREIFARPLEALGRSSDLLVAFTTSGKSPNALRALEVAKSKHMKTIAFTGAKGEHLKEVADIAIVIPSQETARIQEMHQLIYHAWCEYLDTRL